LLLLVSLNAAQAEPPISASGLNTQIDLSSNSPAGITRYDITGGTRSGTNLFHSFGDFNVPNNNIANFLNDTGLPTSTILGRVTGGDISNIFGTIQTTGFGNANLFLMNPAGFLFGPNATVNVGGMVAFTSADYLRLSDNARFNTIPNTVADALLTPMPVAAFGFLGSNPGAITVQGSQFTVTDGQSISLVAGNISIGSGTPDGGTPQPAQLSAPNGNILLASAASPGEFVAATLQTLSNVDGASFTSYASIALTGSSSINISDVSTVSIRGGQFVISVNDAVLSTTDSASPVETISLSPGSSIVTSNSGGDQEADVELIASNVQLDGVSIQSLTTSDTSGGDITVKGNSVTLTNGSVIQSETVGLVEGGSILIQGTNIKVQDGSTIFSATTGDGAGGNIALEATNVDLLNGGIILSQTDGPASGGSILFQGTTVNLKDGGSIFSISTGDGSSGLINISATNTFSITGTDSSVQNSTLGSGINSGIMIDTGNFLLTQPVPTGLPQIGTDSFDQPGGNIVIHAAESARISAGRIATFSTLAQAGSLEITAPSITINQGSALSTRSAGPGDAGNLTLTATAGNFTLAGSSHVRSSTEQGGGTAGSVSATATNSLLLSGGSTIESTSFQAGPAGLITASAGNLVYLTGAGTGLFSETHGSGDGVGITVQANQVQLTDGATISASSTGPGNAGNIDIDAGNQFTMTDSSVTTEATQSGGGAIKITTDPSGTVLLTNSTISASVLDGTGGGGSVNIDPLFVILVNSHILATAIQGAGGNIFITTNLLLPDANSVISASSQFGQNGTVTIQSPNAPISGQIHPLGKAPLLATSLFNQQCASVAGGQFSSFTVAGRNSLPTEPGSWLTSPIGMAGVEPKLKAEGGKGEGLSGLSSLSGVSDVVRARLVAHQINQTDQIDKTDQSPLSLRQIAPPGFLTQAFLVDEPAGCRS